MSTPTTTADIAARLRPVFDDIAATAAQRERDRDFSRAAIESLKEAGFTRLRVPGEYGGFGLTLEEAFPILVELAAADSNIAQGLRPHFLAVESLLLAADSEHRDTWLTAVGGGGVAIGNAFTEVGNRPGEMNTTLRRSGGRWLLDGKKFYSTGALYSDWIQVRARDEEGRDVFAFVERDAPGVTLLDDWDGFGQQLSASGTSVFEDIVVGDGDISYRDYTAVGPYQALAQAHHLSTLTGISRAIERDIVDYVRGRRRSFSHGNGDLPRDDVQVQQVVGEVTATTYAVGHIFAGFARELDDLLGSAAAGTVTDRDYADIDLAAYRAQMVIAPLVLEQATKAFEVGGASATLRDRGLDRHWRNARVLANHNPIIYRARLAGADALNGGHQAHQYTVGSAT